MRSIGKHIRGIVDELMNNAMKANATRVDVRVEEVDGTVEIQVSDNGEGMTAEQLQACHDRLDQPRRHELEEYYGALAGDSMHGSGLSLVGMMTDRSEVKSEKGQGTEITVFIDLDT